MGSGSSFSSMLLFGNRNEDHVEPPSESQTIPLKKRRNPSGLQYPDAEVVALSPTTLLAKNRFVCEVCNKGFPRDQNLQLHKRGHNLPWHLKQKTKNEQVMKRKVYLCPEPSCINHDPSHALGDLTGIKKHYSRKHGEKTFKCKNCTKMYAVQSDLKAHVKTCGTKEYECHCGTLFSRRDSFITHRAFCDALAEGTPTTVTAIGERSFRGTHPSQITINFPSENASGVPQFDRKITNRSPMELKPSPSFFIPSSNQQNQQNQHSFTTRFTNLVNNRGNSGSGGDQQGSTLFSGSSNVSDHSPSLHLSAYQDCMPQLSATQMLQKAGLFGSTFSNNSVTNFIRGYAGTSENGRLLFGNSGGNGHEKNMNEILNSFNSSGVGLSILNRYGGGTYEQEESYVSGIDSDCGVYGDEWKTFNYEEQQQQEPKNPSTYMGFQKYSGVQMTRDFLGVGGEMEGDISSDRPKGTFGGQSFL